MSEKITEYSLTVQVHLGIVQAIIQRMGSNSASCKTWCITVVSALLVIVSEKGNPAYVYLALLPTLLFFFLDSYYLAQEKMFRNAYNDFIDKHHKGTLKPLDLYIVMPQGELGPSIGSAFLSISVWPFYLTLIVMTWMAYALILNGGIVQ